MEGSIKAQLLSQWKKQLVLRSMLSSICVLIALWWVLARQMNSELILPSPASVAQKLFSLLGREGFSSILRGSVKTILVGFLAAYIAGIVTGILAGLNKWVGAVLYPLILLFRTTPVMSFILYLLLFVPTEAVALWVSFLIVYPLVHTNVIKGIQAVDVKLLEMATQYEVPLSKQLKYIYLPSIGPYLSAAAISGMGMNIKAVITAEAMSLPEHAIGTELFAARNYLETDTIIALTIIVIGVAVFMDLMLWLFTRTLGEGRRRRVISNRKSELSV